MATKRTVYFVLLFSVILSVMMSGCASSTASVVGTYTHTTSTKDTYTINFKPDGTYSEDSYTITSSGTWTVEDNVLKLNPSVLKWQEESGCGNIVCPPKATWVPGGNIITYKIGVNQLVDEHGIVWEKM